MLKQALDVLRKAEAEAEQVVMSARRQAAEMKKKAEDDGADSIYRAVAEAENDASASSIRYETEADGIKAEAQKKAIEQAASISKKASLNRMRALNKAVERVVRRNGHR